MRICKLGAFAALGTVLALPAMAQGTNQNAWQQGSNAPGYEQSFNAPNNSAPGGYGGPSRAWSGNGTAQNQPGNYPSGSSGNWQGGGYGPQIGGRMQGNFGNRQFGQGGPANQPTWSNRQAAAQQVFALRRMLEQAGYTDIRIVPESFLVQAHDGEGRPVVMIIGPHSFEAITAMNPTPTNPPAGGAP